MTRNVLIISHADADGHLIAEQTRRNLSEVPGFAVTTFVDPQVTQDHRVWTKLAGVLEAVRPADIVFFVDLMFSPETFVDESRALVEFLAQFPEKKFFLLDHHPLPLRRLGEAPNLRTIYRPDVFDCTFGPRSGLMVVAAICEKQAGTVDDIAGPEHHLLALGMKRASALGGSLPGNKLLALVRDDQWAGIARLGSEDPAQHRVYHGRRPTSQPVSKVLRELDAAASDLLTAGRIISAGDNGGDLRRATMPYDFEEGRNLDVGKQRFPVEGAARKNARPDPKDLEAIVTLLEVAALTLSKAPDSNFTLDQLLMEARELGGDEVAIEERDVKIVLEKAKFLKKTGRQYQLV